MYTNGIDILYRKSGEKLPSPAWVHSRFCQCHLERKMRTPR